MKNQNRKRNQPKHPAQSEAPWYAPPKTEKQAIHIADKGAYLATHPTETAIKGTLRASRQRTKAVGNWWNDYLNTVSGAQAETQKAYADAATQQQGMVAQSSALDTANTQRLSTDEAASAALRGATPRGDAAQRDAAAQAQRNYLADAFGGATATRGANQAAYLIDQKRIGAGQKVKSKMDEQKRTRSTEEDLKNLRTEKGTMQDTKLEELRDKYREEALKRQAFGLEKKKAGAESAEAGREAREDAEENRRKNESQRNENIKTQREGKTTPKGGKAPEGVQNAVHAARSKIKQHGAPQTPAEWAELEEAVAEQAEISPADAAAAVKRIHKKLGKSLGQGNRGVKGATKTPYAP